MPRITIKPAAQIAEKWQQRAQGASDAYQSGVQDPNVNWADATAGASSAYKDGVLASINRDAFKNGVQQAGNETWKKGAVSKGVNRWAPGIAASKDRFVKGFQPVADVLSNLDLPPRRPARDPQNMQRVALVAQALGQYKIDRQKGAA